MSESAPGPEYLKIDDAARLLRVTRRTIYRRIWDGVLPASKIGGLYFIRRQDLDALLAGRPAAPAELPAEATEPLKCSYCFRLLASDAQIGEACQMPGCERLLCSQCVADGIRHCALHTPSRDDQWAAAQQRFSQGALPVLVRASAARLREINFLNRIQARFQHIDTLIHPSSGEALSIPNWDAFLEQADERAEVMRLLGRVFLDANALAQSPLNASARYRLPASKKSPPLEITIQVLSRLPLFLRDGFDSAPLTAEELAPWLGQFSLEAQRAPGFHLAALASTTGWDIAARRVIQGDAGSAAFAHRAILFYLFDLENGELIFNPGDDRARQYAELFTPRLPSEEIEEVIQAIEKELLAYESLTLQYAAQTLPYPQALLRQAFERLAASGRYALSDVPELGTAIIRR